MDLIDVLRSTGAVREFTSAPVGDEVVARILDTARFAPSGANAQAWHVVSVRDPAVRVRLRELYQPGWRDYLAMGAAGLRPWAPTNDRDAETSALSSVSGEVTLAAAQGFAAHLDRAPVLLVVFADLAALAASTARPTGIRSPAAPRSIPSSGVFCWRPVPKDSAVC
jgi:nitroreductase